MMYMIEAVYEHDGVISTQPEAESLGSHAGRRYATRAEAEAVAASLQAEMRLYPDLAGVEYRVRETRPWEDGEWWP